MVKIENHNDMLEITFDDSILRVFKLYWHFRALSSSNLACFTQNFSHNNIWYILFYSNDYN